MMKYKIVSLGCKVNSYETAALASLLKNEGYSEDETNPDVTIINTCSVTATADQKSRQHIRKLRKTYPNSVLVVMGCYSQGRHDFIRDEIKPDIIVGTSNRNKIPALINQFLKDKKSIDDTEENPRVFDYEEFGVTSFSDNIRSYLKIQDGCDNFCSYCLIPFVRGKSRSRKPENIIQEAEELVNSGYQEIVLTGIHVGGYGKDLEDYSFSKLVEDLSNIPNLKSLRISSIEESEIDDHLISLVRDRKNIAKHLHIPLQSGSTNILKAMHRKYDEDQFKATLKKIREEIPNIALTTDVIVGFPGETEEDFQETIRTIKECDFNMLHVFPFSAREKTIAYKLPNQIDPKTKDERVHVLLNLSSDLWDKYTNQFVDKEVEVLIEQYDNKSHKYIGHTTNYIEVSIESDENIVGKYVKTIYKKN